MNVEELREYALSLPYTSEGFPFDETTLVIKAGSKMFILFDIESKPLAMNVKCDREEAILLRDTYSFVLQGYHMNKKHWNTIIIDGRSTESQIKTWVKDSYILVFKSLTKKEKSELGE